MNATLTGLGIALIAALVAALIGPFFIDWGSYRTVFEQQAGRIAGVPVRVMGDVEARILPSPRIRFGHVRVGAENAAAYIDADDFTLDLALTPLLSGQYRVTKLAVRGVDLQASIAEDGTLSLPVGAGASKADLDRISIDEIQLRDARIAVSDAATGRNLRLEGVSLDGQASALSGPVKLSATGIANGTGFNLRASSGAFDNGSGRVKIGVQLADMPPLDVDGTLRMTGGRPMLEGKAVVAQTAGADAAVTPWQASAQIEADPRRISAKSLDVLYGREGQGLRLVGTGEMALGRAPSAQVSLQARQFDLDRALVRAKDAPPLAPAEALEAYLDTLPGSPHLGMPVTGSLVIDSVIAGGDVVAALRADLASTPEGWDVRGLSMRLPGGAAVATSGNLAVNAWSPPAYSGHATLDAPNVPALLQWLAGGAEARPDVGLRKLVLAGDLKTRPGAVAVDNLKLGLDGTEVGGRVTWSEPADGPPLLSAQLSADRLDLDALDPKRMAAWVNRTAAEKPDVQIALRAARLTFAKVPWRGVDVDIASSAAGADIRRLVVADLGGARIEAKGRIGTREGRAEGRIDARIDARALEGIVAVLEALPVPATFADTLRPRAGALAPAALNTVIASTEGGGFSLTVDGTLGGTRVDLDAASEGVDWAHLKAGKLSAASDDGAQLLRQIGLPVASFEHQGAGKLDAVAAQDGGKGLAVEGSLLAGGGRAAFRGRSDDEFLLRGNGELSLEDAGRFAVLLGRAAPLSLPVIPVNLTGGIRWKTGDLVVDLITGFVDGRPASGLLSYGAKAGLGGEIDLASVSLSELVGAAIGPMAFAEADAGGWPSGPISQGLLDGVTGRVAIRTGALEIVPGYVAGKAAMTLALSPNEFALQDITGVLAGGAVRGSLAVRKAGEEASFAGRLALEGAGLGNLVWGPRSEPAAVGTLDVTADAIGGGRTLSAVAGSLTGSGTFAVHNGRLRGLNPDAFARTMALVEAKDTPPDALDVARRFETELGFGDLPVSDVTSAFTMASGVVRVANAAIASDAVAASASADIDLARAQIAARLTLRPTALDAIAGAAAPQATLTFSGPLAAPARTVDTTALTSFLTVRALDREMKRVADFEAQRQERARLAAEQAERRRAAEAEAARLRAITESTGTVPIGELPPPIEFKRPEPAPQPPPARRQVSPFDIFRRSTPQPAR